MPKILDGKTVADKILADIRKELHSSTKKQTNRKPCLSVVVVGEDPASLIYVARKHKMCEELGITSKAFSLPKETDEKDLLSLIKKLNNDQEVDGILVQLPLPKHLDTFKVTETIRPDKDVDGLTALNQGYLTIGKPQIIPCTPKGVMHLFSFYQIDLKGKNVAIIGRSQLVGFPLLHLISLANATPIQLHSRSANAEALTRQCDIVIAACGVPKLVSLNWLKPQAIVIDVGIHKTEEGLVGDVAFKEVENHVAAISPVPGGVGPLTIACLMENCVELWKKHVR